jgi:tripartite-type tricarboxylate transporter receptor subunit TctC
MNVRRFRVAFVAALAVLVAPLAKAQAPYPNQSIRFIVPYAAGGLPDTVARITAQHLQERVGQSVVIENRAGGGAAAAVSAMMGAPADGYTFIVTDGSLVSTNAALFKQLTYNPKDMIPVALLGSTPLFLAAHPSLPVNTFREFIDYVKAHPGQVNYGSSGVGSVHHLSMEAIKAALKLEMTHIPYRGKKVKLLANNGPTRWFQAPDVPPVADVIPGYDLATIVGIYARPGVPQPILDKIAAEATAAINTPEGKKQLIAAGIQPTGGNAAAFDKALKREIGNVNTVVKSAGIEPQ